MVSASQWLWLAGVKLGGLWASTEQQEMNRVESFWIYYLFLTWIAMTSKTLYLTQVPCLLKMGLYWSFLVKFQIFLLDVFPNDKLRVDWTMIWPFLPLCHISFCFLKGLPWRVLPWASLCALLQTWQLGKHCSRYPSPAGSDFQSPPQTPFCPFNVSPVRSWVCLS